ncbi:hypothetical protein Salat_1905100 [Sesamum alatum]|uniref:RNase H type-1 domain-containing protein n=1 Tax=Sesamum alatum TaxID=300844 RepID=A0AAE1Y4Z5_9LAMI|nr:hypothetical protein Salat_1905100 [Sesamum alatum]
MARVLKVAVFSNLLLSRSLWNHWLLNDLSQRFFLQDTGNIPLLAQLKLKFDGAMFNLTHEIGVGVVVRDSSERCIAGMSHKFARSPSQLIVEALATLEAIDIALISGWE